MNPGFRDLLAAFNARAVEYIVVGAHALAVHGHVRATKDLDVWAKPSRENAENILGALVEFGAASHDLSIDDLSRPGLIFQIGVPPESWSSVYPVKKTGTPWKHHKHSPPPHRILKGGPGSVRAAFPRNAWLERRSVRGVLVNFC